jgi:Domain of unknown function (DUF5655)
MSICPTCESELRHAKQWHYCAKVNIGDLFKNKSEELEFIFDKLLAIVVDWENVIVSATKNCIVFVNNKTFLVVRPMKSQLEIKFYSESALVKFPILKSELWNSKFENHIRIAHITELTTDIISLIKQSYNIS